MANVVVLQPDRVVAIAHALFGGQVVFLAIVVFGELFAVESKALGHEVDGRHVLGLLMGTLRPAMVEAVRRCSERLKTGLLTNPFVTTADGHVDREGEMKHVSDYAADEWLNARDRRQSRRTELAVEPVR